MNTLVNILDQINSTRSNINYLLRLNDCPASLEKKCVNDLKKSSDILLRIENYLTNEIKENQVDLLKKFKTDV